MIRQIFEFSPRFTAQTKRKGLKSQKLDCTFISVKAFNMHKEKFRLSKLNRQNRVNIQYERNSTLEFSMNKTTKNTVYEQYHQP